MHGLCTSAVVGVVACCLYIGFRHMFPAFDWRGWYMVRSADIISADHIGGRPEGRENAQSLELRILAATLWEAEAS